MSLEAINVIPFAILRNREKLDRVGNLVRATLRAAHLIASSAVAVMGGQSRCSVDGLKRAGDALERTHDAIRALAVANAADESVAAAEEALGRLYVTLVAAGVDA